MMMSLSMIQTGEKVEVIGIRGGFSVQQRLESMGFVPGSAIQMVSNQVDGPAIIKVKESRVALGRGLMHHIMVKPVDGAFEPCGEERGHHHAHGRHRHGFGRQHQHGKL